MRFTVGEKPCGAGDHADGWAARWALAVAYHVGGNIEVVLAVQNKRAEFVSSCNSAVIG